MSNIFMVINNITFGSRKFLQERGWELGVRGICMFFSGGGGGVLELFSIILLSDSFIWICDFVNF